MQFSSYPRRRFSSWRNIFLPAVLSSFSKSRSFLSSDICLVSFSRKRRKRAILCIFCFNKALFADSETAIEKDQAPLFALLEKVHWGDETLCGTEAWNLGNITLSKRTSLFSIRNFMTRAFGDVWAIILQKRGMKKLHAFLKVQTLSRWLATLSLYPKSVSAIQAGRSW